MRVSGWPRHPTYYHAGTAANRAGSHHNPREGKHENGHDHSEEQACTTQQLLDALDTSSRKVLVGECDGVGRRCVRMAERAVAGGALALACEAAGGGRRRAEGRPLSLNRSKPRNGKKKQRPQ